MTATAIAAPGKDISAGKPLTLDIASLVAVLTVRETDAARVLPRPGDTKLPPGMAACMNTVQCDLVGGDRRIAGATHVRKLYSQTLENGDDLAEIPNDYIELSLID